ncbi:(2Fe-2S)-binding protein [Verticiella sediminum]|uniref:(2Fe-2S)-binding protein n=1 Tax=Verticiella sediminum TaxID=1247510 RepID=A0A556AKH6_9BURK|nr:(2Fe-2S)-binding protein [Verticiella sediminum]TSH93380.1 (2Fe-2S)-binding protein [Verticiella sediminum]
MSESTFDAPAQEAPRLAIRLSVNGQERVLHVEANVTLADALREQAGTTSVHLGCEHGVCGACNVKLDGEVVRSCLTLAASCEGARIVTLEGLTDERATVLKTALNRCHGLQCGYCTPGVMVTGHDLLTRGVPMNEKDIRAALCGNVCRCTGYQGMVRAVAESLEELAT